jgi:hypothetical protein
METGCFTWDTNSLFNICYMEFAFLWIKADRRIFLLQATHGNINIITAQSVVENLRDNSLINDTVNRSKFNLISERANGL